MPRAPRRRATTVLWEGRRRLSVATLPGRGLYVRHLANPEGVDAVHRPTVGWAGSPSRGGALSTSWLRARLDETDVVHVVGLRPGQHPGDVRAAVDLVRGSGTPLVVTGYHLSDPLGADPGGYAAQLDALVPAADAVVTLTRSAADEMRTRWGVDAVVLPHPHVVNFVRMRRERPPHRGRLRVATHLGSLNLAHDPVDLVTALTRAVRETPDADLTVHVHRTVRDVGALSYSAAAVDRIETLVRRAGGTLVLHDRLSDEQLWDALSSVDVSVVPSAPGSHSVWPEACADLGTWAVMPVGSHAARQRPCLTYDPRHGVDTMAVALTAALRTARQAPAPRSTTEDRWTERVQVAEALRGTYERLLGIGGKRALRYSA